MLWHCFSPWKLVPLDIWTSLNLESPLTWFCSHSDVANLIFARELHGILSKQICYLLWLLPLSVISQPLHLENTTLRPFHEAGSFTAMQQKGHHAVKRQLHDTFNSGETAEGKKKKRKKKKNCEWKNRQTWCEPMSAEDKSLIQQKAFTALSTTFQDEASDRGLTRAKGAGLSWLAAPGHDGHSRQVLARLQLKCSCLGTQRRTSFIKPVQGHQKDNTADSSGLK